MDKKKFQKELAKAKRFTDPTLIKRNVKTVIDAKKDSDTALPRGYRNLVIANEECGELIQEVSKVLRGKEDHFGLLQELADVQIGIYAIQEVCGISNEELERAVNVKMDHTLKEIKKTGMYK